ncbi:MAG: toll/interleukin-1 receptor domain-containing protein [Candidatus Thiodiazotropha sp.]
MTDVFISYSRKDTDFVDSLIAFLDQQQVSYFRDTKDLPPAVIWRDELRNAIINADNLLFIISPESVDSEYCRMELEFAAEHNKRLIPLQYRFTDQAAIPQQLSKWQTLVFDGSARDQALNDTLKVIRQEREWHKQGSDYLRRAENWHADPEAWGFLAREELEPARRWIEKGSAMDPGATQLQLRYITESEAFHLQEAEKVQQLYAKALARQLAAQSQVMLDQQGILLDSAGLLAVESMRRLPTLEGDQAIRKALFLLSRKVIDIDLPDGRSIRETAFSASGQQVAAIFDNGEVEVWDTLSGEMLSGFTPPACRKLMFSPSHDHLILLGDSIRVMDYHSGEQLVDLDPADSIDAAISDDGGFLVTLGKDNLSRLWDTDNWEPVAQYRNQSSMSAVAIARDAREVITWNREQAEIFTSPGEPVSALKLDMTGGANFAYSPDGRYLYQVNPSNYTATLYDVASRQQIIFEERHWNAGFSGNSEYFALASPEWDAQVYYLPSTWWVGHYWEFTPQATPIRKHLRGRASSRRESVVRHNNSINSVTLSHSGRYLATTSRDETARVWESARGREVMRLLEAEQGRLSRLHFHRNERYISAMTERGFSTWEITGHRQAAELRHDDAVHDLCFSRDNRFVATISQDRTCRLLDIAENAEVLRRDIGPGASLAQRREIMISPDSTQLLIDRQLILDIPSAEFTGLETRGYQDRPLAVSEDWQYSASLVDGSVIAIADFSNAEERFRSPPFGQKIVSLLINNATSSIVAATEASSLFVWRWNQAEDFTEIPLEKKIRRLIISDSGNRLAVLGQGDKSVITIWDLGLRQPLTTITQESAITDASFDPGDAYLATSSSDFNARIWDLSSGEQICQFSHDADVGRVSFSHGEGRYVASAGGRSDRCCRVWLWQSADLVAEACARLNRDLTPEEWQQYLGQEPYRATRSR